VSYDVSIYVMWLKQCHKPTIWEWFIPPLKMVKLEMPSQAGGQKPAANRMTLQADIMAFVFFGWW